MKSFLKTTLAAFVGCLIVVILLVIFTFSLFGALASSFKDSEPVMPRKAVLAVDLSQITLQERTEPSDPLDIKGMLTQTTDTRALLGIWDAVQAVNAAAEDPAVKFIYLKVDDAGGDVACFEELRTALQNFRAKGKAVIAFTEAPSNGSYYLASCADKIFMSSYAGGMNMITGFSSSVMYYKDILDKLGVNVQLIRHGKYKSAGEPYIRNSMSDENREQYRVMLTSLWKNWAEQIAADRDLSFEQFNALVNDLKLNSPEDFLQYGLVDELLTKSEREQRLCDLYGADKISEVKAITLQDYAKLHSTEGKNLKKDAIAVIYADGEIYDGVGREEIMGDTFAGLISKVRQDSTVKAVVFRVNSPGGSVTASAKIKTEIDLLRQEKPVIASYGSYAASGGYWISNSCDRIFSDANTLTGSIGVFSIIPDFSGTAKKVGIKVESVSSNEHGDMYSGMRALSSDELAYMQESVEDIYDTFTGTVAAGRNLDQDYVDSIGQGRVWAGSDALGIGLVDQIGGLEDAVRYAATLVSESHTYSLDDWNIKAYPAPETTMEKLLSKLGQDNASVFAGTPLRSVEKMFGSLTER
ncbi:MAG: signal peptide peptidase SppA, partial [Bacteroidales bacterium]|nr:signal peptide peptidase SppA [Bacteroidales bacterium]